MKSVFRQDRQSSSFSAFYTWWAIVFQTQCCSVGRSPTLTHSHSNAIWESLSPLFSSLEFWASTSCECGEYIKFSICTKGTLKTRWRKLSTSLLIQQYQHRRRRRIVGLSLNKSSLRNLSLRRCRFMIQRLNKRICRIGVEKVFGCRIKSETPWETSQWMIPLKIPMWSTCQKWRNFRKTPYFGLALSISLCHFTFSGS